MNILEILWVILNILGIFYSVKFIKEGSDYSASLIILTVWSVFMMILYLIHKQIDLLTTTLW